jgi:hypothetical protein
VCTTAGRGGDDLKETIMDAITTQLAREQAIIGYVYGKRG